MIASLMMYDREELAAAHESYWHAIRAALKARGIDSPAELANDADEFEVWKSPDLVLSQTCGMPYRKWLHDRVTLVGTPDFGVPNCPPGYYNSVIVVRADDQRERFGDYRDARFTYNQTFSQSGYAAPFALAQSQGFWFENRSQSHGHVHSARAVAVGRADIAAIDAVTWRLIRRFDLWSDQLRELAITPPTPGLPYIAGPDADDQAIFAALSEAIETLDPTDRSALGLHGLVAIPKSAYLAIPNPPE